jgi:hypothetical protein
VVAGAFDGEVAFVATDTDANRATVARGYVPLGNVCGTCGEVPELANDEELAFYFQKRHGILKELKELRELKELKTILLVGNFTLRRTP